jgi:CYTH domain-containing protein
MEPQVWNFKFQDLQQSYDIEQVNTSKMLSGRVNKFIERWQNFEIRGHMYHFDIETGVFPLF